MATVLPTKPGPNVPDARSSALRKRGGGSRFLPGDRGAPHSPTGGCRSRVGGRVRCGQAPLARGPSSRAPCGDGAPNSAIPMLLGGRFGPHPQAPCPARAAEALCGACAHLRAGGGGLAARRGAGRQGSGQLAQSHAKFKRGVWISQLRSGTPTAGSRLFSQRDGCAFPRQSAAPWLPPCSEGPCGQSPRTPSCPGWAGRGAGVVECYLYTCTLQSTLSVCLVCD